MSISSRFFLVKLLRLSDRRLLTALLLVSSSLMLSTPSYAQSTTPGTTIENQATGSFVDELNNQSYNINSNLVSVEVAEVAGITITPQTAPTNVTTGSIINFDFTVTNIGNDPTQFFIPDAHSAITGGTAGTLQIVSYDPDGSGPLAAVDLTANDITIPAGGANTSTLLGALATANNGSIPAGAAIVVRVPVTVMALMGQSVNVTIGNTDGRATTQNLVYQAGTKDLYTVDNADTIPGEANGKPINGDPTGRRQEASAIQTVIVIGIDYGDAPDTSPITTTGNYKTTLAHGGPSHLIVPGLSLGANIDADAGTLQNTNADADNITGTSNDEDGIASFPVLIITEALTYTVPVNVTNTRGEDAYLVGYIDFNKDGDFDDPGEKSITVTVAASGSQNVIFTTPAGMTIGSTYARLRLSSNKNDAESSIGVASDGEVEDYQVSISAAVVSNPNLLLVKRITAVNGGQTTSGGDDLAIYNNTSSPYDDNVDQTPPFVGQPYPNREDTTYWPTLSNFLLGGTNGGTIKPKDSIEYTIYFLSTGDSEAKNVLFCDRVPANVTFSPDTFTNTTANPGGIARGIALQLGNTLNYYTNTGDSDPARYFPPGIEPSTVYPNISCGKDITTGLALPNDNGAVVVNLGNRPKATGILADDQAAGAYGFIRFRGAVK